MVSCHLLTLSGTFDVDNAAQKLSNPISTIARLNFFSCLQFQHFKRFKMCEVMRAAETWPGLQLAPAETINTP